MCGSRAVSSWVGLGVLISSLIVYFKNTSSLRIGSNLRWNCRKYKCIIWHRYFLYGSLTVPSASGKTEVCSLCLFKVVGSLTLFGHKHVFSRLSVFRSRLILVKWLSWYLSKESVVKIGKQVQCDVHYFHGSRDTMSSPSPYPHRHTQRHTHMHVRMHTYIIIFLCFTAILCSAFCSLASRCVSPVMHYFNILCLRSSSFVCEFQILWLLYANCFNFTWYPDLKFTSLCSHIHEANKYVTKREVVCYKRVTQWQSVRATPTTICMTCYWRARNILTDAYCTVELSYIHVPNFTGLRPEVIRGLIHPTVTYFLICSWCQ